MRAAVSQREYLNSRRLIETLLAAGAPGAEEVCGRVGPVESVDGEAGPAHSDQGGVSGTWYMGALLDEVGEVVPSEGCLLPPFDRPGQGDLAGVRPAVDAGEADLDGGAPGPVAADDPGPGQVRVVGYEALDRGADDDAQPNRITRSAIDATYWLLYSCNQSVAT